MEKPKRPFEIKKKLKYEILTHQCFCIDIINFYHSIFTYRNNGFKQIIYQIALKLLTLLSLNVSFDAFLKVQSYEGPLEGITPSNRNRVLPEECKLCLLHF